MNDKVTLVTADELALEQDPTPNSGEVIISKRQDPCSVSSGAAFGSIGGVRLISA